MAHKTEYRFYIGTDFAPGSEVFAEDIEGIFDDIETTYDCDYIRFTNLIPNGDVKNIYQEDYAEMSGVRVYIPPKGSIAHKAYECKLKLLFRGDKALANAVRFQNDMLGASVQWFDTFRNVLATLLMSKSMNIENERLYGNQKFVVAEYTFTNIDGVTRTLKSANNSIVVVANTDSIELLLNGNWNDQIRPSATPAYYATYPVTRNVPTRIFLPDGLYAWAKMFSGANCGSISYVDISKVDFSNVWYGQDSYLSQPFFGMFAYCGASEVSLAGKDLSGYVLSGIFEGWPNYPLRKVDMSRCKLTGVRELYFEERITDVSFGYGCDMDLYLKYNTTMTHESLLSIINGLADVHREVPPGFSMTAQNWAKLSESEKAMITAKGWRTGTTD